MEVPDSRPARRRQRRSKPGATTEAVLYTAGYAALILFAIGIALSIEALIN